MDIVYDSPPISWYKQYLALCRIHKFDRTTVVPFFSSKNGWIEITYSIVFMSGKSTVGMKIGASVSIGHSIQPMKEFNREVHDFISLTTEQPIDKIYHHLCSKCGMIFLSVNHKVKDTNICSSCSASMINVRDGVGQIYLIKNTSDDKLKIGYSTNPSKRLRQLETGSSSNMILVRTILGGQKQERIIHKSFAHLRLKGEWFRYDEQIVEYFDGVAMAQNRTVI